MLVRVLSGCFHGHGMGHGRSASKRFRRATIHLRSVLAGDLHFTVNLRAFSNGNPRCGYVAPNFSCGPDLNPLAATQCARHFTADHNLAGIDIGGDFTVRPDGNAAIGEMDRALHFPIDIQIVASADFPFNYQCGSNRSAGRLHDFRGQTCNASDGLFNSR